MYDQNNMPARTRVSHYLRTGQKIDGFRPDSYKSSKGLTREKITLIISKIFREPDRPLLRHYFRGRGQTFDLVSRGLLAFITGARVFQKRFSDKQAIDFTSAFFWLGNSSMGMELVADVEANCITKGVSITGNISYEINDWFRDVTDFEDKIPDYQESPGGTPFKMVARWSRPVSLSGRFL